MPSCSYSSNIRAANNVVNLSNDGGNRLSVQILSGQFITGGVSAGDAIYFDVGMQRYNKSMADSPSTAEVFGVVESLDASGNGTVVMLGSIGLTGFFQMSDGGGGGHDIFFLSGTTAGKLQSLAPTKDGHIVKAVYQTAPHGNYTGAVMNYIGYKVPTT
jgi:hypothetical protein